MLCAISLYLVCVSVQRDYLIELGYLKEAELLEDRSRNAAFESKADGDAVKKGGSSGTVLSRYASLMCGRVVSTLTRLLTTGEHCLRSLVQARRFRRG
mgnify:CR=1 FL=1